MSKTLTLCAIVVGLSLLLTPRSTLADAPLVIPVANSQIVPKKATVSLPFALPTIAAGKQVRLVMDVRVDYPAWCANNPAMVMAVNGRNVIGDDLLNKSLRYYNRNGRDSIWATPKGYDWQFYSWPNFSKEEAWAFNSPYAVVEQDPFHFVWDITRSARAGSNTIAFTHREIIAEDHHMELRRILVEVGDPIPSQGGNAVTPPPTGSIPTYVPGTRQSVEMTVELSYGGTIKLRTGKRTFDIVTRTSQPNGKWAVTKADRPTAIAIGKTGRTQWQCQGYSVARKVSVAPDHLHIADTYTNTSRALVGVMHEHSLMFTETPVQVKLGGRPSYLEYQNDTGGANPSSLAVWSDLAVGLVAENDIFRAHAKLFARTNAIGLADQELGVEPGKSVTVEWEVYPVPNGDYWAFINAVRRNWGCNFTIPALNVFVDWSSGTKTDSYYADYIQKRGLKMVSAFDAMYDDGKAAMGTAIPLATQFCARSKAWMSQVHKVAPDTKTLFYVNCTLSTEPNAASKYADSRLLDANGNQSSMPAGGPGGVVSAPFFISTPENSYGRAMMDVCKWIVNDLGADGLYHDLMNTYTYAARAYNTTWDGCTVVIDPKTHAVVRKASSLALLQRPWHTQLVKYLREHGKTIIGNCPVETKTLMNLHIPVFAETAMSYIYAMDTHLGSPWAYGNYPSADPTRDVYYNAAYNLRNLLDYGTVLALTSWPDDVKELTFLQLMHPITPIEIRQGMVIGEERIITKCSGIYAWRDGSNADVYVFNGDGRLVSHPIVKRTMASGHWKIEIRMPSDHFAILVKNPKTTN